MNELLRRVFNLPEQVSTYAADIDALHYVIILTSIVGATGVALAIAIFSSRTPAVGSVGREEPRGSWVVLVEALGIAGLLAFFLGLWVVGYRQYVHMLTPPRDTLDVYVVAKQWMWAFGYADGSANNADLVVPSGRPIRLLLTSRDVIHSFFVPELRMKRDVVPGRMTVAWFEAVREGTFDILCTEYCGLSHSHMRGRLVVLSPAAFETWQRQQERESAPIGSVVAGARMGQDTSGASLAAFGERVAAERGCLRCHTLDGTPHIGPTWAGMYRATIPLEGGGSIVADDAYLTESMMDPLARRHRGFEPVMPSYFGQLSAAETAGLVELIHSIADRRPMHLEPLAPAEARRRGADVLPRTRQSSVLAGRTPALETTGRMPEEATR